MTEEERLYDIFGELLYVLAMADGVVQDEEVAALDKLLENHKWAQSIKWSFDYEVAHHSDVEAVYNKVLHFCHHHGPSPVYADFISAMTKIAKAANGVEDSEKKIISSFSSDLIARFQKDIDEKLWK